MKTERERALETIVDLAREYEFSPAEIRASLAPDSTPLDASSKMGRIFGYLGAIFVVAGIAAFIAINWNSLNSFARVLVTLGTGLALLFYALWNERSGQLPGMSGALYGLSYLLQPIGILVALEEWTTGSNWRAALLFTSAVLAIQAGVLLRRNSHPVLLFALVGFSAVAFGVVCDLVGMPENVTALVVGTGLTLVGLSFRTPTTYDVGGLAVFVGSVMGYWGAFDLLEGHQPAEFALPGLSALGIYASVVLSSRPLLVTSVISLLAFISYFTGRYFAESLGWPIVLIGLGLLFVVVGRYAVRLHQRMSR